MPASNSAAPMRCYIPTWAATFSSPVSSRGSICRQTARYSLLWCRSNKPRPLVSTPRDSRHSPAFPAIRRLADGLLYHCTSPPQHNRPLPAAQPFCEPPCVFQRDEVAEPSPGRGRDQAAFEGVRTAPISRRTEVAHDPTDEIFGATRYARASWPLGPRTPGLVPPGHHRLGAAPGWRKASSLSRSPRPPTAITSTSAHCCSTPSICAGIPRRDSEDRTRWTRRRPSCRRPTIRASGSSTSRSCRPRSR